jgi:hypothetical protein
MTKITKMQINYEICNIIIINECMTTKELKELLSCELFKLTYRCTGNRAGTDDVHITPIIDINIKLTDSLVKQIGNKVMHSSIPLCFEIPYSHTEYNDEKYWPRPNSYETHKNKRVNLYIAVTHSRKELIYASNQQLKMRELKCYLVLGCAMIGWLPALLLVIPFFILLFVTVIVIIRNRPVDNPYVLYAVLPNLQRIEND